MSSKFKRKSLKVFRLKAAILGLKFVNLVMFNCSLLSKTCLNVYRPTSPILSLPGTSCKLLSSAPAVPQDAPKMITPVSPNLPRSPSFFHGLPRSSPVSPSLGSMAFWWEDLSKFFVCKKSQNFSGFFWLFIRLNRLRRI